MADEIYEIDQSGTLTRRAKMDLAADTLSTETASSTEVKEEEASTPEESQLPSSNPILPPTEDPTVKDKDVYMTYLRSMGLGNAIVFLLLGGVFAVTFKFPGKTKGRLFLQLLTLTFSQTFGFSGGPMTLPQAVADTPPSTGSACTQVWRSFRWCYSDSGYGETISTSPSTPLKSHLLNKYK